MKHRLPLPLLGALRLLGLFLSASPALAAPSNDNFANARTLTGDFDAHAGTTVGATRQAGEPEDSGYSTVWYKWTPTRAGRARFSALPASQDYNYWQMSVWAGSSLGNLKLVAHKKSSLGETRIEGLPVSADRQYFICFGHSWINHPTSSNSFELSVVLPTSSDLASRNVTAASADNGTFANALPLSGASNTVISYALSFPANEPGEPTRNPGYSSWYYYDATADGRIRLSVSGTEESQSFDYYAHKTIIAYRAGTYAEMIDSLPVGTSDTTTGLPGTLSFNVVEGQRYYIAFGLGRYRDGRNSGPGNASAAAWRVMTMSYSPPPPPPPPAPPTPSIRIISPGSTVGRTFSIKTAVSHPAYADHVRFAVNSRVTASSVGGRSRVTSKLMRAKKTRSKRWIRFVIAAAVYEPGSSYASSYTRKVLRSKYRFHR